VLVRYRYRLYPSSGQQAALARVFSCARVVYNDVLRLREESRAAGEKITDTEVQRRVITLAKATPQRAWLAEVSSVALVQACNDARRAYRNWFDSLSGQRRGRKIGHPQPRRKHGRQSIRFTRNGFSLHGQRLYVAKVGEICVRWSRPLPSVPSSVTVIRKPDGQCYASSVVDRPATPLPPCGREVGIDVGLARLAVTSEGEIIPNPRFWRAKQRKLARAQRALSRTVRDSANQAKARRRVAVLHRKVRDARLDHAHKTALRLVRDNQAIYAEDLAIAGLARTRLAKSVHDAAWAQLLRLIGEKAGQYGRVFHRIGRFVPTSQVCSGCGANNGPKPLDVRTWTCCGCGMAHDRDVNAARNILAAGRRRDETPVEGMSDHRPRWRSPVKQEPTEVPRERHGRNPRHSRRGGRQLPAHHQPGRPARAGPGAAARTGGPRRAAAPCPTPAPGSGCCTCTRGSWCWTWPTRTRWSAAPRA
jgi:putative transposase